MKKDCIYISKQKMKVWNIIESYDGYVLTMIYEYTIFGFKCHRIVQDIPFIKNTYHDGGYAENERLKGVAHGGKVLAKEWLFNYRKRIKDNGL